MTPQGTYSERDVVAMLVAAARARAAHGTEIQQEQADEYDWNRPCRYLPEQLTEVERLGRRCAAAVSDTLAEVCGADTVFEPVGGISQYYARQLVGDDEDDESLYVVDLADADGNLTAVCTISAKIGVEWVSRLLGGQGDAADQRDLSDLEADLLVDVVGRIAQAIASVEGPAGALPIGRAQKVSKGPLSLGGDGSEEYCRLALRQRPPEDPSEDEEQAEGPDQAPEAEGPPGLCLLIASTVVDVAMDLAESGTAAMTPQRTRHAMTAHLGRVAVTAAVRAGCAHVTMRDLMSLQPGDVMPLERRSDEPVEVVIGDKTMLYGNIVRCDGQYAVQIVAWAQPTGDAAESAS